VRLRRRHTPHRPGAALRGITLAFLVGFIPWLAHADDLAATAIQQATRIDGIFDVSVQSLLGEFLRWQRDVNRALTKGIAALKDGVAAGPLLIAMGIGFLYGAFHAAGPGHGKAVVVSYFLSRDAGWLRGLWMGGQIAAFHVLSALIAVLVVHAVLKISMARPIDQLQPLKVISYGAITFVGALMLIAALRRVVNRSEVMREKCGHESVKGETGLLSMAIGVIPCSGAVLVLIYALANDMLVSGILVTLCIAVGMALTLAAIGIVMVLLRRRAVGTESARRRSWLSAALSVVGPLAITVFGALLLFASLASPA
jgi:ABC-type nickel/cobalt efflux system permease component RcnA